MRPGSATWRARSVAALGTVALTRRAAATLAATLGATLAVAMAVALAAALAVAAVPTEADAQDVWDDDDGYWLPSFSIDALASGITDSNLLHEPGGPESYGFQGGLRVRVQSAPVRPVLRLQWDWQLRHFEASDRLNRRLHRFGANLDKRLGFVELRGRSTLDLNGTTEDRELATVYRLLPSVGLRLGPARLRLEGRYWQKRIAGDQAADEFIRGGEAAFGLSGDPGRVELAVLYEEADAERESRRFRRTEVTGEYRARVGSLTVEIESSFRVRRFTDRFTIVEDSQVLTRDERWTHEASLRYRLPRGTELRLELERQNRASNDPTRAFTSDRITLGVVLPLVDPVPRRSTR